MTPVSPPPRVQIGQVIRKAKVFKFRPGPDATMNTDTLLETVKRLFALLQEREVEYVLVGGIAMLQYVEGRNTEDLDLIMAAPALQKTPEITLTSQEQHFARGAFEGLQIDLLLTRHPLFEKVQRQYAVPQRFIEQTIPCASVEGLLLLKLYALPSLYRQGNFVRVSIYEADIATLLQAYQPSVALLFKELARHLSASDLAAVKTILAEIEQRIARFQQGLGESD